ncbi:MAG: hypothetical protein AAB328_04605, partial [candidate division NC10 bacterium]
NALYNDANSNSFNSFLKGKRNISDEEILVAYQRNLDKWPDLIVCTEIARVGGNLLHKASPGNFVSLFGNKSRDFGTHASVLVYTKEYGYVVINYLTL